MLVLWAFCFVVTFVGTILFVRGAVMSLNKFSTDTFALSAVLGAFCFSIMIVSLLKLFVPFVVRMLN